MPHGIPLLAAAVESPALLHELGDVLEVGILALDAELVVRGANRWLAEAIGVEASALHGRSILDVFPELRGGPTEAAFRRALTGMSVVLSHHFHRYLLPIAPPAGFERFDVMQQSARVLPIFRDGRVDGVLAVVQDVTERVAREAELRRAMEHAEVASSAKSEFLAAMSHELRTPLSAVIGYTSILEDGMVGPLEALQQNYLGRIKAAAGHLLNIIEEILTFSRVEAGKEEVRPQRLDAAELAREVEVLFEPQAQGKGLTLTADLPAQPVPVCTDPTKLRQILINLLGNAVKFTDAGEVALVLAREDDAVRFRVRDTGPGIAEENLDRIFEPFTQVDGSWKRPKGGTGLGLPVSQKLAQLLGGEIGVESTLGEGSTFTLLLPLSYAPPAAHAHPDAS